MTNNERQKQMPKAKIAVALQTDLGRVPTEKEMNNDFLLVRKMYLETGSFQLVKYPEN